MAKRRISDLFGMDWLSMSKDDVYNQTKSQYGVDLSPENLTALYGGQQIDWNAPVQPAGKTVATQSFDQTPSSVANVSEPAGTTWVSSTNTTTPVTPTNTTNTTNATNATTNLAGQTTGDAGGTAPGDSRYMYRGSGAQPVTFELGDYYNVNEGGGGSGDFWGSIGGYLSSVPGRVLDIYKLMNPWTSIGGPQQGGNAGGGSGSGGGNNFGFNWGGSNPDQSESFEDMTPGGGLFPAAGDTFTLPNQPDFSQGGWQNPIFDVNTGTLPNQRSWGGYPGSGQTFGFFDTGDSDNPFGPGGYLSGRPSVDPFDPTHGYLSRLPTIAGGTSVTEDAGVDPASLAATNPRSFPNPFQGVTNTQLSDAILGLRGDLGGDLNRATNALTGRLFGNSVTGPGAFDDMRTRFGNLDTQFGDLNTRFGGLGSDVRGINDFLRGSQAGPGAFDNLYNRMGSRFDTGLGDLGGRFDTGFNQLGGGVDRITDYLFGNQGQRGLYDRIGSRFDTGLGVLGDRFGEDISGLQGAIGQDIGGIRSKLFGDSVVGEGAFDILGNRFDTGMGVLGGQMGDLSTQVGDIESKLWGNSVVGPGAFDLMGDRFTTGLDALGRTLGRDIGGLGDDFRRSDMFQRSQLGDLLSGQGGLLAGQQGIGSDIANLLLGQQGIGEDFGQVTSDFGDISSRFGDINARLDSFFNQAMDGGPDWLNDPMSLYEMMEPRMREDLRAMLPGEEELLPEWMQGGERAFLDRIAPQLFPQGDLNDMLTEILGDPLAAMQNEIEQLKSGGLLAELNKLQDVDAVTGGDAAGEATPFAGMAGENIFESPPELAMPEITDYTQALQMPLYNDLLEAMGAASPYDTRRDEVLGGETAYLDKIYDEKRENLENRFAVMDQLGSPGFRKAMADLEEDRAQAKLGITSEFGREAARGDEAIRRGRAQDLASALGFERGRVRDEMSFQDQLQRQATQDFNNYLDQVFRSYMAPQDSYDNALRMMLGGLGTAIQPNIGAAMTGLGGQRGAVGTYQDKMDQNMRNYQMMLNPGAFENM